MTFTIPSGEQWQWRRIVFAQVEQWPEAGHPNGRNMTPISDSRKDEILYRLFRSTHNLNFMSYFNGLLDRKSNVILYDKVCNLRATTTATNTVHKNSWTPLNKKIVYQDIEQGSTINYDPWADGNKTRNIYIMDMFATEGADDLRWEPAQRTYWHEN